MFEEIMKNEIDPSYQDKIILSRDRTKKFLYSRLIKVVLDHGYVQNEYDMCTFNMMMNGEQITVQFHVDDSLDVQAHWPYAVALNFPSHSLILLKFTNHIHRIFCVLTLLGFSGRCVLSVLDSSFLFL